MPFFSIGERRRFLQALLTGGAIFWGGVGCRSRKSEKIDPPAEREAPRRIISTVPSVTETLFVLGLGNRVVAVSDYCRWPKATATLPKIGGLFNPNFERIVELRPDLVLALREHTELADRLQTLGFKTITVDHSSVAGILASFEIIGQPFGPETRRRAAELTQKLSDRIAEIERQTSVLPTQNVLISIDRERGTGKITQVSVAGNNPYFNELLRIAGGKNVFAETFAAVPTVSLESLMEKNPDVIFDFATDWSGAATGETEEVRAAYLKDWSSLGKRIDAVRNGRIYPILTDYATVPGPRFVLLIETLARRIHPEITLEPFSIFDAVP